MFWKLVISALVLPASIGLSSAAAEASTNSKISFLDETSNQNLVTTEESPQLIATYHNNCSYGYRRRHSGHGYHKKRYGGHHNNNYGGGHGGHHRKRYGGGHGGHHNNNYGGGHGGHHNNNYGGGHGGHHNQGYYNH